MKKLPVAPAKTVVAAKPAASKPIPAKPVASKPSAPTTARKFFAEKIPGFGMTECSKSPGGPSYATIRRHVVYLEKIEFETAEKLEKWSDGRIDATLTMKDPTTKKKPAK